MRDLYLKKGGDGKFNCRFVRVDMDDLERLKRAVINDELPDTEGFFFGRHYAEDMKYVLEFIDMAKACIETGDAIYYSSWW